MTDTLTKLIQVIESRKSAPVDSSYVASLHSKGLNKILEKVGEEATEVILAAKDDDSSEVVKEIADLWFHSMVLLSHQSIGLDSLLTELESRFGRSGIEEKASRDQ